MMKYGIIMEARKARGMMYFRLPLYVPRHMPYDGASFLCIIAMTAVSMRVMPSAMQSHHGFESPVPMIRLLISVFAIR